MRVGIQTWGSEGDVRPFFALAEGLVEAGHQVTLQYSSVEGRDYGAELASAPFSHRRVGTSALPPQELAALCTRIFSDSNPLRQMTSVLTSLLEPVLPALTEGALELADSCDVLVHHMMAWPLAAAAELRGKPRVMVLTAPMIPTRAFPLPGTPDLGPANRLVWRLALAVLDRKFWPTVLRTRASLGLPPIRNFRQQLAGSAVDLCAVSPTLMPRPLDWPAKAQMSGFLSPQPRGGGAVLPPEVEAFFAEGPAPVFVSFGSMTVVEREPGEVFRIVQEALAEVGCRAIVQAGATQLAPRAGLLAVGPLPHQHVFPRCAAIVHHGGAGTTQSALRAGRPSVVVAHFSDQLLWGRLLRRHGVAPPHLQRRSLRAGPLAAALKRALTDTAMQQAAAAMGEKVRAEDGVGAAVKAIERVGAGR